MVLESATRSQLAIRLATTNSPLDRSLSLVGEYLSTRFEQQNWPALPGIEHADSAFTIDIGVLGLGDTTGNSGESYREEGIFYPIRFYHSRAFLGPIYYASPAQTHGPCPLCFERRWISIRLPEEQEALYSARPALILGQNPRITAFALEAIYNIIEATLSRFEHTQRRAHEGDVYVINLESLVVQRDLLIEDSLCPLCSRQQPDSATAVRLHLSSRIKRSVNEYHLVPATAYPLPKEGYVNTTCGMLGASSFVDEVHTITSPVSGMFGLKSRFGFCKAWWGGHGNSYRSSYYLGLLEALERYSGFLPHTRKSVVFDSYEHLSPDALDPTTCGLYSSELYREKSAYFTPFSYDGKIPWVWGYSLRQQRPLLVPEQMVYYMAYRSDAPRNFVDDNSNGCATGSTLEEAILFGLFELIERDAFLITWYASLAPPRIDPWSCRNRNVLAMLDRIDRLGYDVHLLDTRLDINIPSVVGAAVRREPGPGQFILAAGAHLNAEGAIQATLCEVGAYISGFEQRVEKNGPLLRELIQDHRKVVSIEQHALLYGLPEMAQHADFLFQHPTKRSFTETYASWEQEMPRNHDLLDDLQYCLDRLFALDLDVIVVEQTSPEQERVGLKTACVIVPGLMPLTFGYGQERVRDLPRLRTAPRIASLLKEDFAISRINITPHPFP